MLFSALFRKNISSLDDLALVKLIKADNNRGTGELYKRYATLVMGLCMKYMKDQMKAEDMLMVIFEKLPAKVKRSEIANFKNWLFSVARNECLMELRKKKTGSAEIENTLLYKADEGEQLLEEKLQNEATLLKLEEAIDLLKEEQKNAISLFYIQKNSYDQVSEKMKITVKKVKSLIQNGKRNLKIALQNEV